MRVAGSMKRKIVATELVEERARCNFDQDQLFHLLNNNPLINERMEQTKSDMENDPNL